MSVAIRTATRLQDQDDVNVTVGAGVDEYALCWDNDTLKFVLRAPAAPFAGILATGATVGATAQAQTFTLGVVSPFLAPAANSTSAVQVRKADQTTSVLNVDTTNGRVGIWTTSPANALDVNGYVGMTRLVHYGGAIDIIRLDGTIVRAYAQVGGFAITSASTGTSLLLVSLTGIVTQRHYGAAISSVTNLLVIDQRSTGTPVAGYGSGVLVNLASSTSNDQNAARIQALWYEATHATRKADLVLTAYDSGGEREGLRIRANGSAAAIGFLGATPAARIAHVADPSGGGTVDAEARSAINSILATLESFGFHATS